MRATVCNVSRHMVHRTHWISAIERLWEEKSVVWLKGVRRAGKTFLCQSLADVEYFDCELPSARQELNDPERFLRNVGERRVILDEIHRLPDPSELLKIAADYHPKTHIVATGSSSLGASRRFRDTLTDRKRDLWLTPMLLQDEREFGTRVPRSSVPMRRTSALLSLQRPYGARISGVDRLLLGARHPGTLPPTTAFVLSALSGAPICRQRWDIRSNSVCYPVRNQPEHGE